MLPVKRPTCTVQYVLHTLTVAWPLEYHTAHHTSGSMSGMNEPPHFQWPASLIDPQRPTRHNGHSPSLCTTAPEMPCFPRTRWQNCLAVISVFAQEAIIPLLSGRAWRSSRRLKPKAGNQKQTILATNSTREPSV